MVTALVAGPAVVAAGAVGAAAELGAAAGVASAGAAAAGAGATAVGTSAVVASAGAASASTAAATAAGTVAAASGPVGWIAAGTVVTPTARVSIDWSCWKKCVCCPDVLQTLQGHNEGIQLSELLKIKCIEEVLTLPDGRDAIRNHSGKIFGFKIVNCPVSGNLIGLHAEEITL
ncbi:hypothetical protein BCR33DRAFT_745351 [Rhizoclosmatium globosum]|uniref:Uncharacterized protein n=1 Tax=Rhizoclosmatium globosum TaxID=329046 RepID=A0A1Y2B3X5_9FUNG|nr:hypothetical protein BCR33DRAFT_745351 [Rhizoclosmatium globosum]|eukprot:ORY29250.1 hypothetical protein BCR33DRAFT_745351 [Rhizoclosmatium globosum]